MCRRPVHCSPRALVDYTLTAIQVFSNLVTTAIKILDNILAHPEEEKFLSLKLENKLIKARIVDAFAGVELMKQIGFKKIIDDFGVHMLTITTEKAVERQDANQEILVWLKTQLEAVRNTGKKGAMADCTLQLKLSNGTALIAAFSGAETLQTVHDHVEACHEKHPYFTLCANYPYVEFTGEKLNTTLADAGLLPRASLFLKRVAQENTESDFTEDDIAKAERLKKERLARERKVKAREDEKKSLEVARKQAITTFQDDRALAKETAERKRAVREKQEQLAKEKAQKEKEEETARIEAEAVGGQAEGK